MDYSAIYLEHGIFTWVFAYFFVNCMLIKGKKCQIYITHLRKCGKVVPAVL